MECIICGKEMNNPEHTNFCPNCGSSQNPLYNESSEGKTLELLVYRILQMKLGNDFPKYFGNHVDFLQCANENNYSGLLYLVSGSDDAISVCKETLDILTMYSNVVKTYEQLKGKTGLDSNYIHFPGFDSQNETHYYDFAFFLLNTLGVFKEINNCLGDSGLDSHHSTLALYHNMLKKWHELDDGKNGLSKDELNDLLIVTP